MNIYQLLEHLETRKAMYLGNNYTFHSLSTFITGFEMACDESQLETDMYNNFSDFNSWLIKYLPEHFGEAGGWYWQLSSRNINNDDNAFKEFFELLEVFKTAKL